MICNNSSCGTGTDRPIETNSALVDSAECRVVFRAENVGAVPNGR